MNAKDVAALAGISVRTLHHYDQIGLLSPTRNPENGYREYSDADLDRLQQILFFRKCGFPLSEISAILDSPDYDREKAWELQRKYLLHERERIDTMLDTLEKTIQSMKGEISMTNREKFKGFDFAQNSYEEEARVLWGDEAVDSSNAHLDSLGAAGQEELGNRMNSLFTHLATLRDQDPASAEVQEEMEKMFVFFNTNFGHTYTLEAFARLGQMYVDDERFTQNIDQFGAGLSGFLAKAMGIYAKNMG